MNESNPVPGNESKPASPFTNAVNIFTSPAEAFSEIEIRPTKLIPLVVILGSLCLTMFWYFSIVDFDWYVDDALSITNMSEAQREEAREAMLSMNRTTFMWFGIAGSAVTILLIWILQAGYLSLVSALTGDRFRFTHWFSLVAWTGLTALLSVVGMVVNLLLNTNGQLSAYELDPLTLANLGMQSSAGSMGIVFNSLNLPMFWGVALMVMAYRQWLQTSWARASAIVTGPYVVILGLLTYNALT
ncbi:MAG: YIP1 family protein [Gammaproteobacteria bacterium]